jgi:hypothetical protein
VSTAIAFVVAFVCRGVSRCGVSIAPLAVSVSRRLV